MELIATLHEDLIKRVPLKNSNYYYVYHNWNYKVGLITYVKGIESYVH